MPKTFKKAFRTDGCTARVYRRKIGKESYTYDIKYRRNSYNVTVTDKNLDTAKKKFIEKLKTAEKVTKTPARAGTAVPTTFNAFASYYFENFRKKKVTTHTSASVTGRQSQIPVIPKSAASRKAIGRISTRPRRIEMMNPGTG